MTCQGKQRYGSLYSTSLINKIFSRVFEIKKFEELFLSKGDDVAAVELRWSAEAVDSRSSRQPRGYLDFGKSTATGARQTHSCTLKPKTEKSKLQETFSTRTTTVLRYEPDIWFTQIIFLYSTTFADHAHNS